MIAFEIIFAVLVITFVPMYDMPNCSQTLNFTKYHCLIYSDWKDEQQKQKKRKNDEKGEHGIKE